MTSHFYSICLETQKRPIYWYARWFFCLVFTALAKWRVEFRTKIGHSHNIFFGYPTKNNKQNFYKLQNEYLAALRKIILAFILSASIEELIMSRENSV